jgi:hypothetical protein
LELILGEKSLKYKLDYEGVPFRCKICHRMGILKNIVTFPYMSELKGLTRNTQRSIFFHKGMKYPNIQWKEMWNLLIMKPVSIQKEDKKVGTIFPLES